MGNGLLIRAEGYRTSQGVVGSGFFWLVSALSALTVWMLLGNWRHTRRRVQAQQALVTETNFRRAMENSMLTGMRALDLQGRITYVNPAFCQMTGWTEAELVGRTAPFPLLARVRTATPCMAPAGRRAARPDAAGRLRGAGQAQERQHFSMPACMCRR